MPSRYEGFGLPALEAMRCGAAVVAGAPRRSPRGGGRGRPAGRRRGSGDAFAAAFSASTGDPGLRRQLRAAALARAATSTPRQLGEATLGAATSAPADADADTARDAAA
jgi:glycosyltransferase involved in cell wall biosynthesis